MKSRGIAGVVNELRVSGLTMALILGLVLGTVRVAPAQESEEPVAAQRFADLERRMSALEAQEPPPAEAGSLRWKDGLRLQLTDGVQLQFGGRVYIDWAWFQQDRDLDNAFDVQDGTEFRAARLFGAGKLYHNVDFKLEVDFAGGDADFKDVYVGLSELPWGMKLRVGHFFEPIGLEQLTSSRFNTFMERSLPTAALARGRNSGVQLSGPLYEEQGTWRVGVFRDVNDFGNRSDNGKLNASGRVTYLPWYEQDGACLLHLGASYSLRNPNDSGLSFSAGPEANLADDYVDTGLLDAGHVHLFGLESAWVCGQLSLQAEYLAAHVDLDAPAGGEPFLQGCTLQASYFLTGEHRAYRRADGVFGRITPLRNYRRGEDGGCGAWELAARVSWLDLSNDAADGGEILDATAGVNWYLNPHTRVMANYIRSQVDSLGDADIFQMRFQFDF